jgi:alkanesulfonate monooxygenase SsuD/methylene tetrahydromethanopterin reductase-like flavin-dependent oxidoreductase (luciferase family)
MKIGLHYTIPVAEDQASIGSRYDAVFRDVEWADGKGFNALWLTEHHFSNYSVTPSPLLLLTKAAEVSKHMRVGTGILVLPLWDPIRIVADISTLDVLSRGRVDLGIGRGYQPHELRGFGQEMSEGRERFEEAVDLILQLFNEPDETFWGKHYNVPVPVTVLPRPIQQPHPPIWMAASNPDSIRYGARKGFHLMTPTLWSVPEIKVQRDFIEQCIRETGAHGEGREFSANRFIYCGSDEEGVSRALSACAWQSALAASLRQGGIPDKGINPLPSRVAHSDSVMSKRLVYGTPDQIVKQMEDLADAGVSTVLAQFHFGDMPTKLSDDSMKRFASEVLPRLHRIRSRPLVTEGAAA